MKKIDSYLNQLKEQKVKIPVKHPGILGVPEGKDVEKLPLPHFKALIKSKGWETVSKALTNLIVWNKKKNPSLSSWANKTQAALSKWVDAEREAGKMREAVFHLMVQGIREQQVKIPEKDK